ncbi:hypothetical protein C0J52_28256 [Blattella germanica]|nr:hypothetical protein C0J52_28256 [Blattella germanica]
MMSTTVCSYRFIHLTFTHYQQMKKIDHNVISLIKVKIILEQNLLTLLKVFIYLILMFKY